MNWIATNIRFPEDEYMQLKLISAQKRESLSSLVRNAVKKTVLKKTKPNAKKIMAKVDRISKALSKSIPENWDTVKVIREMRRHGS